MIAKSVCPRVSSRQDFKDLVAAADKMGIKVLMAGVPRKLRQRHWLGVWGAFIIDPKMSASLEWFQAELVESRWAGRRFFWSILDSTVF